MILYLEDSDGSRLSDQVAAAAKQCLRSSPYFTIRELSCEHDEGVLVLRGRLPSFYHKQLAQTAVAGVPGVAQVVNLVEVHAPAG